MFGIYFYYNDLTPFSILVLCLFAMWFIVLLAQHQVRCGLAVLLGIVLYNTVHLGLLYCIGIGSFLMILTTPGALLAVAGFTLYKSLTNDK